MSDCVDVAKYVPLLRDPMDGGPLRLNSETDPPCLIGETSKLVYRFVGPFPDLRPGRGIPVGGSRAGAAPRGFPAASHERVLEHYDDKPCNNYLALDNVPLGRYMRDPAYDWLFEGVEFLVEVGSGKGAIARTFKEYRGLTPFCVDLAYGSLRHVRAEPLHADGVLGSNLCVPLADAVADMVVSYGVIHHTPDPLRCFSELARILKPGGKLLLNVYNWENLYRSLYYFLSPPLKSARHMLGRRLGDRVLKFTVFPPYYLALWSVLGIVQGNWQPPGFDEAYEQFGDFFLTPIARFYHAGELRTLGEAFGLKVLEQTTGGWPGNGFAHFVWYQKP